MSLPQATIQHAKADIVEVIGRYVELQRKGAEYVACCPFHSEKTPSFTVNPDKGFFYCFGCGAGGDAVDFVQQFENVSFREAVERIVGNSAANSGEHVQRQSVKQQEEPEWTPVVPVPADIKQRPMDIFNRRSGDTWEKLTASKRWEYRDANGDLIGLVSRFELPGGGKDVLPQSYCINTQTGEMRWRWMSFAKPRPLYGLDKLAKHPAAQVLVVEGEKTADAAQSLYEAAGISRDKLVVVSWPGGGKAVRFVDWSPLAGRGVALWPDADQKLYPDTHAKVGQLVPFLEQPGTVCVLDIADRLAGVAAVLKFIEPPAGVPDGWDLGDPLPAGFNLLAHTKAAALPIADFRAKHGLGAEVVDLERVRTVREPVAAAAAPAASAMPQFEEVVENDAPAEASAQGGPAEIDAVQLMQPTDFPDLSAKLRPLNTISNLASLMQWFGVSARYNMVKKETELVIPGLWSTSDNAQNVRLAHLNSLAARCALPRENLPEYVKAIADMNAYNPCADWIDSKPWDGVQRIGDLAKTLTCKDPANSEQCEKLLRRWLISCAAALVHQGFWCKGVLTLQGAQDLGKTSWFRRLVPAELGAFREGVSLDPNNKDSVTTAVSHWIVELGELESTLRREIESLKAFITQTVDRLRRPYDRLDSEYPRRTVFCASVNSDRFLKDETGNDRFWVIEVVEVNHKHDVDMQQLWAEVMALYRGGEQWHLDVDEKKQLTETNAQFRQVSPFEELLLARFSIAGDGGKHMSASQILIELGYDRPTRAQATEAGQVLSRLGAAWKKSAGSKQYYLCPLSCSDNSPF